MQAKNFSLRSALGIVVPVQSYLTAVFKVLKSLEICGILSSYKIQAFQVWFSIWIHRWRHIVLKDPNHHFWLYRSQPGQPLIDPFYMFLHSVMCPVTHAHGK